MENVNGTSYENKTIRAFVEDGLLYIVLSDSKYAFDLDTIAGFRRVDTPIAISGWNKTISYTEPYFQSCGVTSPEDEPGYQTGGYSVLSFDGGDTELICAAQKGFDYRISAIFQAERVIA